MGWKLKKYKTKYCLPWFPFISIYKIWKTLLLSFLRWLRLGTRNFNKISDPFISEKKIFLIIGFMVFKTTGFESRFKRKNWFWKIRPKYWNIGQNVSKICLPNQTSKISHILADISGLCAYFSKPIFALKPSVRADCFEYHEPYNPNIFFRHITVISETYLSHISDISQSYLRHISGKSQAYFRHILGMCQTNLRHIWCKS